jgi:hypothetical protein
VLFFHGTSAGGRNFGLGLGRSRQVACSVSRRLKKCPLNLPIGHWEHVPVFTEGALVRSDVRRGSA